MGYRSYQIVKHSEDNIHVFCRSDQSDLTGVAIIAYPFARFYSRLTQLFLKTLGQTFIYNNLRKFELFLFNFRAKKFIRKVDIVHFFYHDEELITYANKLGKKVVIEAFSHPAYLKKMRKDGIQFDSSNEASDDHSIPCYEKSDLIISPSPWVSMNLTYAGLPDKKIDMIKYGVTPQPDREAINNNKLRIIFAGGLKRTKGVIELITAISELDSDKVELFIFGRMHKNIASQVKSILTNSSNIYLKGFSNNILDEYKKADLYVYPSYFEGSSKTVFEAMSCGLPVITTFNAGSIVIDKVDGYIVPINNSAIIKEKINELLQKPDVLKEMSKSAQINSRKYTWQRYALSVNEKYKEIQL